MTKKKKCSFCKNGLMQNETRKETYEYKDKEIQINQSALYCSSCDEAILEGKDLKNIEKELHDFKAKVDGFLTSSDVRKIRKKLGITQKEAAEIFGGGPNAFSRYESGKALQIKATDNLLRLLDSHPELLNEIRSHKEAA